MSPSGRRRSQRIIFNSTAVLRYGDGDMLEVQVDTRNISLHGLFLVTETRLPPETPCTVEISLIGATSMMEVVTQGVIRRYESDGMAIDFTHLDPDSFIHILNLVKLHEAE